MDGAFAMLDSEGRFVYLERAEMDELREWVIENGRVGKGELWEEAVRRFT